MTIGTGIYKIDVDTTWHTLSIRGMGPESSARILEIAARLEQPKCNTNEAAATAIGSLLDYLKSRSQS